MNAHSKRATLTLERLPSNPRSQYALLSLVSLVAFALAIFLSPNFAWPTSETTEPYGGDFLQEWIGGHLILRGEQAHFYDPKLASALEHDSELVGFSWDANSYLPMVYPPFYYWIVSPISRIPFWIAAPFWAMLMAASLVIAELTFFRASNNSSGVIKRLFDFELISSSWNRQIELAITLSPLLALLFVPVIENITSGQKGTLCLLILCGTFLLLDSRKPFQAGLLFGLLAFKPQLTLVIAFAMLFKREWRFVAGGGLTGAILVGLSLFTGTDVSYQYFQFALGATEYMTNSGYDLQKSHCLYGFFAILLETPSSPFLKVATLASSLIILFVLGSTLLGKLEFGSTRFAYQFASMTICSLLLSPHLFGYDLTILLLPMILMLAPPCFSRLQPSHQRRSVWIVVGLFASGSCSTFFAEQYGFQISTLVMIAAMLHLLRVSREPNRGPDGHPSLAI